MSKCDVGSSRGGRSAGVLIFVREGERRLAGRCGCLIFQVKVGAHVVLFCSSRLLLDSILRLDSIMNRVA